MAPPPSRRPGYSRKAQYGLFAAYVIAVVGAVGGLLLVLISAVDPRGFASLRMITQELFAPASRGMTTVTQSAGGVEENLSAYFRAGSQNKALRRELEAARTKLLQAEALRGENDRLKALLALKDATPGKVIVSRLLSTTANSTRRFAMLDAGSLKGVAPGMPVRSHEGLIGRVLEVGPTTARVLLLYDGEMSVPVRRASDGMPGLASGNADGMMHVQLSDISLAKIGKGDLFVTSGSGGLYPPNIPVAVAITAGRDRAQVRAAADIARVDAVMVLPIEEIAEPVATPTGSMLPAAPISAPATSGTVQP